MKVYGWTAVIDGDECALIGDDTWRRQARKFTAARSMAAVARAAGVKRPSQLFNLTETGNALECETALAEPGVIFVLSMNQGSKARAFRSLTQGGDSS